ncbi:hypothetical protein ADIS_3674 [Lunatimonas lonarensis]|uniref:DUF2911 domain-containing protein n=1 Tax=Lunatimonas lonarensis TaxID=1232681 RepID=R7ZP03_9BACT|nr:DUF2911 domain-containing protein [Lunatimonas lonarensis]EON75783.1 hypothetical protein ADIS_3674 [Lunatimonas lonarensis]
MTTKLSVLAIVLGISFCWLLSSCGEQKSTVENDLSEAPSDEVVETRASPLRRVEGAIGGKQVKVQYGSPAVKGRKIWGDLVPYNEVWRTGANEATHIEFAQPLLISGQTLPPGKYSIFTIPRESGPWTVIFNSEWDLEHGHYQYKEEHDVLRVTAEPTWESSSQESLSIEVVPQGLVIKWEKLNLPITIE